MKNKDETSEPNFRIRLEARLKNDALATAREQIGWTQKSIAAVLKISEVTYGNIERMSKYPNKDLMEEIVDFYADHGIILNPNEIFPAELKKAKFSRRYVVTKEIPPERLLPLSTLDRKLLMPVEIDDRGIRNEDLQSAVKDMLYFLTDRQANIIKMHFGLPPYEKIYTDKEIGEKYNLTGSRVGQIREKAIRRLRHSSRKDKLKFFLGDERINS